MTTPAESSAADEIKARAASLGFDLVGIAPAGRSVHAEYFAQWLSAGRAGSMAYLSDRFDERTDPAAYLPGAASVICLAVNYYVEADAPRPGRIARYARGLDYHDWLKQKLYDLADWVRDRHPGTATRCGADSVPVMEKELAVRAGIGWMGKNTCVISPRLGSWILLGEVLTTLPLPPDGPVTDRCGSCTRCIDACPTAALTPYRLDATRCVSYLTIEHRGDIPEPLRAGIGDWLYGCDVCQDVCPFNRRPTAATTPQVRPVLPPSLDPDAVLGWSVEDYRRTLKGTAMKRVKLPVLQRNAAVVRDNRSLSPARPRAAGAE